MSSVSPCRNFSVVSRSALCLIPPETLWGPIQEIRTKHDKQLNRWMPHINILYPFYEDVKENFNVCDAQIAEHLVSEKKLPKIEIVFNHTSFNKFLHGRNATLLLSPSATNVETGENLQLWYQHLQDLFPNAGDKRFPIFQPHLSLGQFNSTIVDDAIQNFSEKWKADGIVLRWQVDELCLISRADFHEPFSIKRRISVVKSN